MPTPPVLSQVPARPIDDEPIYDLLSRRHALPTIALAHELGIFERIADHPQTIEAVAASLEITPRAAEALMAVSAALGFLRSLANGEGEETLIVCAEGKAPDAAELKRAVAAKVAETAGLKAGHVAVVQVGSLPKTSSGKVQRRKSKAQFEAGELEEHLLETVSV